VSIKRVDPVEKIAALVSEALTQHGVDAVLSGGAVVSIYSRNEFQSHDLDFISSATREELDGAMDSLGFKRETGRHYVHPRTEFIVEFPSGPLMVGDELVQRHAKLKTAHGVIRLLTPTDAVKDRLAAFFHWSDRQALEQALAIVRQQAVKLREVARWARSEPAPAGERYEVFASRIAEIKPRPRR
jgi:hypothetical protein